MAEKTLKPSSRLSRSSARADAGEAARKLTTGKKAVIATGGKQYLVAEGEELDIELIAPDKTAALEALLVINGDDIRVGAPEVQGAKIDYEIIEQQVKADKVTAIRYKAKKRVNKRRGHRQKLTRIKVTKIT